MRPYDPYDPDYEEEEEGGGGSGGYDPSQPPGVRRGYTWGVIGGSWQYDEKLDKNVWQPRYGWLSEKDAPRGRDPSLGAYRDAQIRQIEEERQYKRERDALADERYKEEKEYNRAISEGRYKDAEEWKRKLYDRDKERDDLDRQYRDRRFAFETEIGYAGSRRADVESNLRRQQQAFNQEQMTRQEARETARHPASYLEYAFTSAGVPPPPGTRLAEVMGRIKPTPDVETFLGQQYGPGPQTSGHISGPPMAYDENAIRQELEDNRAQKQAGG